MCGIFGILGFDDKPLMKRMCKLLHHRGPDGEGMITDSLISVGNTRLSIIDLETGNQPIPNEDKSIWVVANCEIYNYKELRERLTKSGHIFHTNSDTEVIVHAYEEFGKEMPKCLEGDFAFAIWNRNKELFLARDRFGVNPLYYSYIPKEKKLIFASEIKAILDYKPYPLKKTSIIDFFTYMYVPKEKTLFEGILKLLPGEFLVANRKGIKVSRYWQVPGHYPNLDSKMSIRKIREIFDAAVKSRMMSDVPIGALLSGGIDSSSIVAIMSKYSDKPIKTYTVAFDEEDDRNARNIVRTFNTDHHEVKLEKHHFKLLPEIVYYNDCLISDPTLIPTFLISRLARKKVKVVLGGEGADDIFGGYSVFKTNLICESSKMHARPEKRWLRYISFLRDDFTKDEKTELLGRTDYDPYAYLKHYFSNEHDYFTQLANLFCENYLPHDLLIKVNAMCMANSVEARVPFLHADFASMVISKIPNNLKLNNGIEKWIFREAMKGIVPNQNRIMRKKPFSVPVEHFFKGYVDSYTFSNIKNLGIFDMNYVNKIVRLNRQHRTYSRQLWALISFNEWCGVFKDKIKT